jgi:hypothetical protein
MKRNLFGRKPAQTYLCRPKNKRRVGQGVKTPPFHGGITGSNPVRGTKKPPRNWGLLNYIPVSKCNSGMMISVNPFFNNLCLKACCTSYSPCTINNLSISLGSWQANH